MGYYGIWLECAGESAYLFFCCESLLGGWVSLRKYWDSSTGAAVLFDASLRESWELGIGCVVGGMVAGANYV